MEIAFRLEVVLIKEEIIGAEDSFVRYWFLAFDENVLRDSELMSALFHINVLWILYKRSYQGFNGFFWSLKEIREPSDDRLPWLVVLESREHDGMDGMHYGIPPMCTLMGMAFINDKDSFLSGLK